MSMTRVVKRVNFSGSEAVLFANDDIFWGGLVFPGGRGANLGLIAALYCV